MGSPVDFAANGLLGEATAAQDTLTVFDHLRMAAEVNRGLRRQEIHVINVFAQDVFQAADFTLPFRIFPRPAHHGNILKPFEFPSKGLKLVAIGEFPGTAGGLQHD